MDPNWVMPPSGPTLETATRVALVAIYAVVTVVLVAYAARQLVPYGDWNVWAQLPARLADGTVYEHSDAYTWAWSPLAAWLIAFAVLPLGPWAWAALHVAVLSLLRGARLILPVASSYPFWMDGPAWLVVGISLAAWLTVRNHPGWAGLAISPYLVPQYLLILVLDVARFHVPRARRQAAGSAPTAAPANTKAGYRV